MTKKLLPIILIVLLLLLVAARRAFPRIRNIADDLPKNGEYPSRSLGSITDIVIHHSAVDGQGPEDYARYHTDSKGWPGIGYHFVIQPDGRIYQTNPLTAVSYHVAGHNAHGVGICVSGNLSDHPMTAAQKRSVKSLITRLKLQLPNITTIQGHRDYGNATDCPGDFTDVSDFQ